MEWWLQLRTCFVGIGVAAVVGVPAPVVVVDPVEHVVVAVAVASHDHRSWLFFSFRVPFLRRTSPPLQHMSRASDC